MRIIFSLISIGYLSYIKTPRNLGSSLQVPIKPLSKAVTSVFRLFYNQIENYNMKCCYFSSVKTFWVIENNHDVLKSLDRLNKRGKADCISTFDFSTLYTKIPHDKLIAVLNEITDTCFNGGSNLFLPLNLVLDG